MNDSIATRGYRGSVKPTLLFAHGAGAPSTSDWMTNWAQRLRRIGDVVVFDYPYMREGRRRPDHHDKLLAAHRAALLEERKRRRGKVVLIGKSMGSRIGCHLALEEPVAALICLGYPLVSPGKARTLRDEVLLALDTPIQFVQGTRDRLCPLDTLAAVREKMRGEHALHVVDTGDHSLRATKTWLKNNRTTQASVDDRTCDAITAFVARHS